MRFSEWDPIYESILADMGFDRPSDESSARLLKVMSLNSNMVSEESLHSIIKTNAVVAGGNISENDIATLREMIGADVVLISAGSATDVLMEHDIVPNIIVTDLDGNVELQKMASAMGSLTLVHAHGDNTHLITKHVKDLSGEIMITTQSVPDVTLHNFGGFTDGDRAVCLARHFGSKRIFLIGFDLDVPASKGCTDMEMKRRKLAWAKKIIYEMNPEDVVITSV
jgi:uncharacterized Rossmann fold enzyme